MDTKDPPKSDFTRRQVLLGGAAVAAGACSPSLCAGKQRSANRRVTYPNKQ